MFEVGDEIRLALPQKKFMYAVVTNVDGDWITAFIDNGRSTAFKVGYGKWDKTGIKYPEIVSVLSQLSEKEVIE